MKIIMEDIVQIADRKDVRYVVMFYQRFQIFCIISVLFQNTSSRTRTCLHGKPISSCKNNHPHWIARTTRILGYHCPAFDVSPFSSLPLITASRQGFYRAGSAWPGQWSFLLYDHGVQLYNTSVGIFHLDYIGKKNPIPWSKMVGFNAGACFAALKLYCGVIYTYVVYD